MRASPCVSAALLALSLSAFAPASSEAQRPSWAGPAQAGAEGIYESLMVTFMNGTPEELPGEGKIGRDGSYQVEIETADAGTYTLCLKHASGTEQLDDPIQLLEAGELKFEGNLGTRTLVDPSFKIIVNGGDCVETDPVFSSGVQTSN